jgi:hypothetical protein
LEMARDRVAVQMYVEIKIKERGVPLFSRNNATTPLFDL